jgi:MoaA/NifB/PqqE/SkfB family radical SAM enzyme
MLKRIAKPFVNWIKRKPSMLITNLMITNRCVQNCLQCGIPQQRTKNEFMTFEDYQIILERLIRQGTLGLTFSGGEPMLHPDIERLIAYAHQKKFLRLHILTTLYYSDQKLDTLINLMEKYPLSLSCSFDGFGETADYLRGAKNVAETVEKNMRKLDSHLKNKGIKRKLGINIVASQLNLKEIPRVFKLVEELGWKANLDIYRWRASNQTECDELKITDLAELEKVIALGISSPAVWTPDWLLKGHIDYQRGERIKICPYLLLPSFGSKFFINADGEIRICFGESIGNIIEQEPEDIFNSDAWKNKLEQLKKCSGCWNSCYTITAGAFRYKYLGDIRKVLRLIK